jgi:ADP-ribose pyrophosphatase
MQIPPHARRVFEGILFDVYQWEQEQFDGTIRTFEMISRKHSVDIIATIGKDIVVLEQEQPGVQSYPSLPGGIIEKKETPLAAAKRELLEETGYTSEEWVCLEEFKGTTKVDVREFVFVARDCKKIAEQRLDCGEKISFRLVSFSEFLLLCRNDRFVAPFHLKTLMYETLLHKSNAKALRKRIFGE